MVMSLWTHFLAYPVQPSLKRFTVQLCTSRRLDKCQRTWLRTSSSVPPADAIRAWQDLRRFTLTQQFRRQKFLCCPFSCVERLAVIAPTGKKVKVAHTRLPIVGFRSWFRFLAVSLQVAWVINPAVGCHSFPPGLQLPRQPLRGLLPILLLGEQRHDGCEQFAWDCYPTASDWT